MLATTNNLASKQYTDTRYAHKESVVIYESTWHTIRNVNYKLKKQEIGRKLKKHGSYETISQNK